jgi:RNA polymerase sigma factor (sigma-70 family)
MKEEGVDFASNESKDAYHFAEIKNVLEAIEKLDPIYKDVLIFRYIDNLLPREIAEILGESENVVSVRLNRGIKKIREIFNE